MFIVDQPLPVVASIVGLGVLVAAGWLTDQLLGPYARTWAKCVLERETQNAEAANEAGSRHESDATKGARGSLPRS